MTEGVVLAVLQVGLLAKQRQQAGSVFLCMYQRDMYFMYYPTCLPCGSLTTSPNVPVSTVTLYWFCTWFWISALTTCLRQRRAFFSYTLPLPYMLTSHTISSIFSLPAASLFSPLLYHNHLYHALPTYLSLLPHIPCLPPPHTCSRLPYTLLLPPPPPTYPYHLPHLPTTYFCLTCHHTPCLPSPHLPLPFSLPAYNPLPLPPYTRLPTHAIHIPLLCTLPPCIPHTFPSTFFALFTWRFWWHGFCLTCMLHFAPYILPASTTYHPASISTYPFLPAYHPSPMLPSTSPALSTYPVLPSLPPTYRQGCFDR